MKNKKQGLSIFLTVFICLSLASVSAVSAYNPIPTYKNVNLTVANDNGARFDIYGNDKYNFFSPTQSAGQGLNALHLTTNINDPYGSVTNVNTTSGTFYLSDTGGRGWDDDGILMIAVNGSMASLSNFAIQINSSGYQWTPVASGAYPAYNNTTYNSLAVSKTFSVSDFNSNVTGYNSTWKPCPYSDYPIYEGQNMGNTSEFHIIFVDLYAGIIGQNTLSQSDWNNNSANVSNKGMIMVKYAISGLPQGSMVSFNGYAFCNSSNQGQGIRWTNSVNIDGTQGTGTSGYSVRNF